MLPQHGVLVARRLDGEFGHEGSASSLTQERAVGLIANRKYLVDVGDRHVSALALQLADRSEHDPVPVVGEVLCLDGVSFSEHGRLGEERDEKSTLGEQVLENQGLEPNSELWNVRSGSSEVEIIRSGALLIPFCVPFANCGRELRSQFRHRASQSLPVLPLSRAQS